MSTEQKLLNTIIPDPDQPRKVFKNSEMEELKRSIKKQGILTPLIVENNYKKDKYLLIDGERRYRCAKELKLERIPVEIIEGPLSYEERATKRFHIQLQHSSWSELDKARAIYEYKKNTQKTIAEIAEKLNLHIPKVHGYLSVLEFTEKAQKLIVEHDIDFTYLIFLIRIVKHYLVICDLKQEYIEEKIINKVITNTFKIVKDIQIYSKVMNYDEHKEIKIRFLEELDFSFEDFISLTDINRKEDQYTFYKILSNLDKVISKNKEKKDFINKDHIIILKRIKNKIDSLL